MSKNISIKVVDTQQNFTGVSRLNIDGAGGSSSVWIPQDETDRGSVTLSRNGEFSASEFDVYGFSEVVVNVPSENYVTGRIDGLNYKVSIDDGAFVRTEIPESIQVSTLPTTISYVRGAVIDYTGMVVKMKRPNATDFTNTDYPDGIIPSGELLLPVTAATTETIPVMWLSPYTNTFLKTSFEIEITEE